MAAFPTTKRQWLAVVFFLSGVGTMTARVGQQGGMYLFQFLIPLCLAVWSKQHRNAIFRLGVGALCLYFTFDLIDLVHWAASGWSYTIPLDVLTKSKFSSILGGSGIWFLVIGCIGVGRTSGVDVSQRFFLAWFIDGLAAGSVALLFFGLFQFFTGFDFSAVASYRPDRLLDGGFHRIAGMSSHPLSLAGLSLGLMVFCGALSMRVWPLRGLESEMTLGQRFGLSISTRLLLAAGAHGLLVVLSGSRTATALALLFGSFFGGFLLRKYWRKVTVRLVAVVIFVFLGAAVYRVGFVGRVTELFSSQTGGDQRLIFWGLHWKMFTDHIWIGHGRYYLESVARDAYYATLYPGSHVQRYNAHNVYLEVLAMGGMIGSLLIVLFGILFMKRVRAMTLLGGPMSQALWLPWCLALVANALHGMTQNTFFDSAVLAPYMYVVWLTVSLALYRR